MITTTVRTVCALRMEEFVPAHFNIDSERRLVTVRFDNEVTVRDVVQYLESLKANPASRVPGGRGLIGQRSVQGSLSCYI